MITTKISPCIINKKYSKKSTDILNFLKIITEENRLKILCLLKKGPKCVCEIWPALDIPQNLTSHHLQVLKEAGLVNSKKSGLRVFYKINKKIINNKLNNLSLFFKP